MSVLSKAIEQEKQIVMETTFTIGDGKTSVRTSFTLPSGGASNSAIAKAILKAGFEGNLDALFK